MVKGRPRINQFMPYRLSDAESRYLNTERECLAVVRCLAEIRWLVMGSPHPVLVYTDHSALQTVLSTIEPSERVQIV